MTKLKPIKWFILLALLFTSSGNLFAQADGTAADPAVTADVAPAEPAAEEEEAKLDTGDTAWMLTATVLVLLMTLPGLALFYGGLVRSKNILSVLVQCFVIAAVMTIVWIAYGYVFSAAGGEGFLGQFFNTTGSLDTANGPKCGLFLGHLTDSALSGTMPESVWITFQMTFIIITPALIVGAFAERMKFAAVLVFTTIWTTFSYLPIWHMAWGGGLFDGMGVIDFAGGTVVHINAGIAGLVACIMVGKRKTSGPPHNVPLVIIGAALLWVGWFGFNAGSAGGANESAGFAMLTTQIATAAAVLAWLAIEWLVIRKVTAVGAATGAVAGLVAITPASGSTTVLGALVIGIASGLICFFTATTLKRKLGYDDSLDVFGVHGIGGIVGALLTGLFLRESVTGAEDFIGIPAQFFAQLKSVVITIVWSGVVSVIALTIAKIVCRGLRTPEADESEGLDTTTHGETAYTN